MIVSRDAALQTVDLLSISYLYCFYNTHGREKKEKGHFATVGPLSSLWEHHHLSIESGEASKVSYRGFLKGGANLGDSCGATIHRKGADLGGQNS